MRLAIHQPNFLPRLKVLQKLSGADRWVILDSVQFAQAEWQNRAKILPISPCFREFWLTLPVTLLSGRQTLIKDVRVVEWPRTLDRCRQSLRHAFRAAAHWNEVADYWSEVEALIQSDRLVDVAVPTTTVALKRFASLPEIIFASGLAVNGHKSTLMANTCEALGATEYLADTGALGYLQPEHFKAKVVWQLWSPPIIKGDSIGWRNLSFLSFLARHGATALREHLLSGAFGSAEALTKASV